MGISVLQSHAWSHDASETLAVSVLHYFEGRLAGNEAPVGHWVKEGVGLVVHFPLEDVAKINTP